MPLKKILNRTQFEAFLETTIVGNILNIRWALRLFVLAIIVGVAGFMIIESYSFIDAFYMAIITISTVGFTEVRPMSDAGRLFTSLYILFNVGIFAYAASAFTYYVIQGELFKNIYLRMMNRAINDLEDHIIICGYGRYGSEVSAHFMENNIPFVIIEQNEHVIQEIQKHENRVLFIEGDASQEGILELANIENCKAVITALGSDADNMFTVLTARTLNANIQIISRAIDVKSVNKIKLAGANHVIMPEQIGGFYMATLISKPRAVEFFTFITNEDLGDVGFEEMDYEHVPHFCQNKTIKDLKIRQKTGTNVIGYRLPDGRYIVNPGPDTQLVPGSSFIVIGSDKQIEKLNTYIEEMKSM